MIKNYIVDFGGVLYRIELNNAVKNLSAYSENFDLSFSQRNLKLVKSVVNDYEKGLISTNKFRDLVKSIFKILCTNNEFDEAWNSILMNIEADSLENIKSLKLLGKVVLLSNTNELHYNHFEQECKEMFEMFDDLFFSYQIKQIKPEPEIYHYLMRNKQFKFDETIFIDDSLINIQSANEIGLKTFQVQNYNLSEIIEILTQNK